MRIAVLPAALVLLALSAAGRAQPAGVPADALASIAVGEFVCRAAKCYLGWGGLGTGIADALTTVLVNSGKFAVYERSGMGTLASEADLSGGTAFQGSDLVVFGSITAFEPEGGTGRVCVLFVCTGGNEATIVADMRVVDVKTRRTIAATPVEGKSTSQGVSIAIPYASFGASSNPGVEKAVAAMLKDAVDKLVARVPASYYKSPQAAAAQAAAAPPAPAPAAAAPPPAPAASAPPAPAAAAQPPSITFVRAQGLTFTLEGCRLTGNQLACTVAVQNAGNQDVEIRVYNSPTNESWSGIYDSSGTRHAISNTTFNGTDFVGGNQNAERMVIAGVTVRLVMTAQVAPSDALARLSLVRLTLNNDRVDFRNIPVTR